MTALRPGAIAIVQLAGDVEPVLGAVTGRRGWPVGSMRLASLGGIDEGIVVRLDETIAQLMPHGGPRVVQRLMEHLHVLGCAPGDPAAIDPRELYPEAADEAEAVMLAALARAASPLAIDVLLEQPARWRSTAGCWSDDDLARSRRLDRLVTPPRVVLAGASNVGKSTLSNALLGRSMSIALDQPGTTRDYTSGRIELAGLVVDWHDTPGLRESGDEIETKAIDIARRLIESCDLLVAMTDADHDWPALPREADLRVGSKGDICPRDDADIVVSAVTGAGVPELVRRVRDALVFPEDLAHPGPWIIGPGRR